MTARPSGVVLKYVLPAVRMWNAPRLQRREALARERVAAVDDVRLLRAVAQRALADRGEVRLVGLAEVGNERVRRGAVLAHPRDRAARVEAAGEGDADVLGDRERAEDRASACVFDQAHAACLLAWISSASCAPVVGSRAMRRTVFSPATVPAISRMAREIDRLRQRLRVAVRRRDDDEVAARLDGRAPSAQARPRRPVEAGRVLGERVDETAARVAHLHEAELVDVARDRRLDDVVPLAAQRFGELGLRRDRLLPNQPLDRRVPFRSVHCSTSSRIATACSMCAGSTTSGGARRRTFGPDVRQTSPASRAASTTPVRAGRARRRREAPRRALPRRRQRGDSGDELGAVRADAGEQRLVDRVEHRARRGARDGIATERRSVIARLERAGGGVRDEERADRQAVREALRERDEIRLHAELLPREERSGAADAGLHLVEAEECVESRARRRRTRA